MTTMTFFTHTIASPLGALRLYSHGDELCGIYLPEQAAPEGATARRTPILDETAAQLAEYFAGRRVTFELALGPRGTGFQRLVWRALETIPYGATRTYGELAAAIGRPSASRAVGAANGRNPLSIVVPCHRVIGASGALTGYAGGMAAKQWLLAHERRVAEPASLRA
jgi:methylated-DNA-[protein]-cysteine S-methyltransferase